MRFGFFCFLFYSFTLVGQEKGDMDYVFQSLEEALERPEQVYHLKLDKEKLDEFPKEIFSFSNLISLDLSRNRISLLPAEIGTLKKLQILDLSKNEISILPPQIGELEALEVLLLSKNKIEELPEALGNLTELKKLDLWQNDIERIDPAIQNMEQLELLDLRGMILSEEQEKNLALWLPHTRVMLSNACDCTD